MLLDNRVSAIKLQKWPNGVELNRVSPLQTGERAGYDVSHLHLKRPHQNELLSDTHQKRGRKGACVAIIMRNSDPSIAVPLYIDHKCMIYM